MRKILGLVVATVLSGSAAFATDLNVAVQTDAGASSITVGPGATVNYQVVGVLSDTANEGLALYGFDLVFDGGALSQADSPTEGPIANFVVPDGITNPAGFGGTLGVPGREGELVQIGGGQNTIKNDIGNAPYPISEVVMTTIGHTEAVLATGSLTAPGAEGTYTLSLTNLFANVIKEGEDEFGTFWAVEEAGVGTIDNLSITVELCAIESTVPQNCALDARQPSMPDGTSPSGWDSIDFTFTDASCATGLVPGDFTVTVEPAGTPPMIDDVLVVGATATLMLDGPIPMGAWTCFSHGGTDTCIGWLPGDTNGDRTAAPLDILRVIDYINEAATSPWGIYSEDIDRSGVLAPPDILRVIDLLNGAGVYDPWLNVRIEVACPSE